MPKIRVQGGATDESAPVPAEPELELEAELVVEPESVEDEGEEGEEFYADSEQLPEDTLI